MKEEKGDSVNDLTSLMHEMNVVLVVAFNLDIGSVLWELIELGFDCPPVEMMLPVESQSLDFRERDTTRPEVGRVEDFGRQVC